MDERSWIHTVHNEHNGSGSKRYFTLFKMRWLQLWVLSYWIICHRKSGIANFFSIMSDEVADISNIENLSVVIRFLHSNKTVRRIYGILTLWGWNNRSSYQRFNNWCCRWLRTIYGWLSWPVLWWCRQYVWALEWSFITYKGWTWQGYLRSLYEPYA